MENKEKTGREELVEIYNNLLPPLKKQVLNIAKIVEDTQEVMIAEYKGMEIIGNKENKK